MKNLSAQSKNKAFTLIELLVVIVIITTLAVTVFVALDPAKRLADARDARRTADVNSILTAIHQAIVDNNGNMPSNTPALGTTSQLGTAAIGCATHGTTACGGTAACSDLMSGAINLSSYLSSMPVDPNAADANETGYSIVNNGGIITVTTCLAENA